MSYCCTNCFNNYEVLNYIKKQDLIGDCSFCDSKGINIANMDDEFFTWNVRHPFRDVKLAPENNGFPIERFLTRQVDLLNEGTSTQAKHALLSKLFRYSYSEEDFKKTFRVEFSTGPSGSNLLNKWYEFKNRIKHENRFGFGIDEVLKKALTDILTTNQKKFPRGQRFYRARLGNPDGSRLFAYEKQDILAAPKDRVSEGRINPRGIPYLYVTNDVDTAIAEVRPYKGKLVSVATVKLTDDTTISSFNNVAYHGKSLVEQMELYVLTNQINWELSHPIDEDTKYLDYIPYQYISELAKHLGLDGIEYRSALEKGTNVCFFIPRKVEWIESELYEVQSLEVIAKPVNQFDL